MQRQYMELNWEGAGYHCFPATRGAGGYASAEEATAWAPFEQVLGGAKQGDFSGVARLLTAYDEADWLLGAACAELMGDIGHRAFFDGLRPVVAGVVEPTYSVDLGRTLAIWGHLSAVPTLLDTLTKITDFEDAPALVQMLSILLEPEPGALADIAGLDDIDAYAAKVNAQLAAVSARVGTADAIVMFGELFSVDRLVAEMRRRLSAGSLFDPYLRHKFEATTGVDCSAFYADEVLQPMQVLAVIEEFEDRGGATPYVPGQRYFFGHPVPA